MRPTLIRIARGVLLISTYSKGHVATSKGGTRRQQSRLKRTEPVYRTRPARLAIRQATFSLGREHHSCPNRHCPTAASVLNSARAVQVSVFVVRAQQPMLPQMINCQQSIISPLGHPPAHAPARRAERTLRFPPRQEGLSRKRDRRPLVAGVPSVSARRDVGVSRGEARCPGKGGSGLSALSSPRRSGGLRSVPDVASRLRSD